tara:strand:+ start:197 stop:610 length:414 start_codon:yes stop_codon:yes gene_type:complete
MIEEIRNINSGINNLRKFANIISIILLIIAGILYWQSNDLFKLFLGISIIFILIRFTFIFILKPLYWLWMGFAIIIGWFMQRLILSILFFTLVTPIGLLLRILGKRPLELNWDNSKSSYWNKRLIQPTDNNNYEKQF